MMANPNCRGYDMWYVLEDFLKTKECSRQFQWYKQIADLMDEERRKYSKRALIPLWPGDFLW